MTNIKCMFFVVLLLTTVFANAEPELTSPTLPVNNSFLENENAASKTNNIMLETLLNASSVCMACLNDQIEVCRIILGGPNGNVGMSALFACALGRCKHVGQC